MRRYGDLSNRMGGSGLNEEADGEDGNQDCRRQMRRQDPRPLRFPWEERNRGKHGEKVRVIRRRIAGEGDGVLGRGLPGCGNQGDVRAFTAMPVVFRNQGRVIGTGSFLFLLAAAVIDGGLQFDMPILPYAKHEVGNGFAFEEDDQAKPEDHDGIVCAAEWLHGCIVYSVNI